MTQLWTGVSPTIRSVSPDATGLEAMADWWTRLLRGGVTLTNQEECPVGREDLRTSDSSHSVLRITSSTTVLKCWVIDPAGFDTRSRPKSSYRCAR
jgi:hypothetical protein